MYFKDYTFRDTGDPIFYDLDVDTQETYRFNMCLMRIPAQFKNVTISENDDVHIDQINSQNIYGLTLLNIHKPIDNTLAKKTFLEPHKHYGPYNESIPKLAGLRGCKSLGTFGNVQFPGGTILPPTRVDKVPLFLHEVNGLPKYYMLSLGIEATIGYCEFKDQADMISGNKSIQTLGQRSFNQHKRIGVKVNEYEIYNVDDFSNNYGVHTIRKSTSPTDSWGVEWFPIISY